MWPFSRAKWPVLSTDEIRKRARILVIDDQDFPYQKLFEKDGYSIEKWSDVKDLGKLEAGHYDILLLDIQGVGRKQSQQEQGFGILKHVHQINPAQIIIAYSNEDYSFKYRDFFDMADAIIAKSEDYVQFKRTVDRLLADRFSAGFYVQRIVTLAAPHVENAERLKEVATRAVETSDRARLKRFLDGQTDNADVASMVMQILEVAISIVSLCRN